MLNTLGERIAYYRKKKDLTQEQLAEQCSISAQAVSKWENNLTAPDISLLPHLAEIFDITCDELLGVQKSMTVAIDPNSVDFSKALLKVRIFTNISDLTDDEKPIPLKGQTTVNINLPLSAAEVVLNSGVLKELKLEGLDLKQIFALAKSGIMGKLVEIKTANGDIVEVWIE